jgi:hypothetical protein
MGQASRVQICRGENGRRSCLKCALGQDRQRHQPLGGSEEQQFPPERVMTGRACSCRGRARPRAIPIERKASGRDSSGRPELTFRVFRSPLRWFRLVATLPLDDGEGHCRSADGRQYELCPYRTKRIRYCDQHAENRKRGRWKFQWCTTWGKPIPGRSEMRAALPLVVCLPSTRREPPLGAPQGAV